MVAQHLGADPVEGRRVDPDRLAVDEGTERLGRLGRRVRGGPGQQAPDAQRPLDGGHLRGVQPGRGDAVDDVTERAQRDRLLAERGQHAFDVCRVGGGGAHDEDAAGLEPATVGVEEVGRAVQGDDGLAGARSAGDLGDPARRGPDRLVLVALDGGDDVAHLGAAAAGQRGQQRAVADDHEVVGGVGDHEVVLDPDDVGALAPQHPAAQDVHGFDGGGPVEGGGGGGAPVDDERLVVVVADTEPADVADLAVGVLCLVGQRVVEVEPAEDEPFVLGVEGGPSSGSVEDQGVPLEQPGQLLVAHVAGAVGAAAGEAVGLDEAGPGLGLGELGVDEVDVGLLDGDLAGDLGAGRLGGRVLEWSDPVTVQCLLLCGRGLGRASMVSTGERTSLASRTRSVRAGAESWEAALDHPAAGGLHAGLEPRPGAELVHQGPDPALDGALGDRRPAARSWRPGRRRRAARGSSGHVARRPSHRRSGANPGPRGGRRARSGPAPWTAPG